MTKTKQEEFWSGEFGANYTDRNTYTPESWDQFYLDTYGTTKIQMNEAAIGDLPKNSKILEVGCNIGLQLLGFQRMGFTELYGVELQHYAVEEAKKITRNINIIQGSGFDLPFRDNYFDVVCTNGVLIHIAPEDYCKIMTEVYRVSKQYIMGFEYYAPSTQEINYRGNQGFLWKSDFASEYQKCNPGLKLVKQDFYKHSKEPANQDAMFLLQKN